MKFSRSLAAGGGGGGGVVGAGALGAEEVARDAVRLVVVERTRTSSGDAARPAGAMPAERARDALRLTRFARLPELLRAGDVVVVNDAATLPASLRGESAAGAPFELRLAEPPHRGAMLRVPAEPGLAEPPHRGAPGERVRLRLVGVVFGPGEHTTRTEDRAMPPPLVLGERVRVAGLAAEVVALDRRRVELAVHAPEDALWQALYAHGAPVQYAHRAARLALWDVQTAYAARPWSAEMPSAGRPLTWDVLLGLRRAGVAIASLTHAAGLSSTGDAVLDAALPWPERYAIPARTAQAIGAARAAGGRVIAIGTTVVRALEASGGAAGEGVATLRIGPGYAPRVVDGLVSGLHVPGESHFELLSAFAPRDRLARALELAAAHGLSAHELGDACLLL